MFGLRLWTFLFLAVAVISVAKALDAGVQDVERRQQPTDVGMTILPTNILPGPSQPSETSNPSQTSQTSDSSSSQTTTTATTQPTTEAAPTSSSTSPTTTTTTSEQSSTTSSSEEPAETSSSTRTSTSEAPEPTTSATEEQTTKSTSKKIVTSFATVTRTNSDGSLVTTTSATTTTSEPDLDNGKNGGSGGMTTGTRNTIIGVVVGIGGALLLGGLALVAWRIRTRKREAEENERLMEYDGGYAGGASEAVKSEAAPSSSGGHTARSPFQSTLENYHAPTQPVNSASNF